MCKNFSSIVSPELSKTLAAFATLIIISEKKNAVKYFYLS